MRSTLASLSSRASAHGKNSITRASAFSLANGSRSSATQRRSQSRSVRSSRGRFIVTSSSRRLLPSEAMDGLPDVRLPCRTPYLLNSGAPFLQVPLQQPLIHKVHPNLGTILQLE